MRIAPRPLVGIVAVLIGLAGFLTTTVGASDADAAAQRTTERLGDRSYGLYRPAALPESAPLVVVLHGALRDGRDAERRFGWNAAADQNGFAVAYPDGLNGFWNAGSCCGTASLAGVDDVAFISDVVADVGRKTAVDTSRVYVTGMSNGAMMTYRLACETSLFAAAAPVAGTLAVPCDVPASILHIHGTGDRIVPHDAGLGLATGPGAAAITAGFRARGGCDEPTVHTKGLVTRSVADCPAGRSVELIAVRDAGHQWPGGGGAPGLDAPTKALDATAEIWRFFSDKRS